MKKLIIASVALLMTLSSLAYGEGASNKYVTRDYDLKGFTGISASGIYDVKLEKSDTWKVTVSMPQELEDYMEVKVTNGKLVLSNKQVPLRLSKNYKNWTVTATVAMPVLKSLSISGAAKFETNDSFDLGSGTFKLEVSGAGKANGLDIIAKELDMEMNGATSATLSGEFDYADIEMGGAAKCNFSINADKLEQELSGAAKAYHNGNFNAVDLEASGASVFSLNGAVDVMEIEGSGAAKIETSRATAREVRASVSGATNCEINAFDYLRVDASGASSVRYVDNDNMKLDIRSISRGSSITKMR